VFSNKIQHSIMLSYSSVGVALRQEGTITPSPNKCRYKLQKLKTYFVDELRWVEPNNS
jgi:hypothetical protein